MVRFGQLVIGPPGSGKTTYCKGIQKYLSGEEQYRKVVVVNLDPANDTLPYKCDVDIADLITVCDVMDRLNLGPNGAMIYCMEYLETNISWLHEELDAQKQKYGQDVYFMFDCPGQVELYTHHRAVHNIVAALSKLDYRLCAVHLVDSHYCVDASKFIAVLLTSLSAMLQLELPHINVLSKVDLIEKYGSLSFNIDYYTEVLDLQYVLEQLQDDPFMKKYNKLNESICGVIEDYSLVSFNTLSIQDSESIGRLLKYIDKATGYYKGQMEEQKMLDLMAPSTLGSQSEYSKTWDVRERYMESDENDLGKLLLESSAAVSMDVKQLNTESEPG